MTDEHGVRELEFFSNRNHVLSISSDAGVFGTAICGMIRLASADMVEEDRPEPVPERGLDKAPHVLVAAKTVTMQASSAVFAGAQWLFTIGSDAGIPNVDGLVSVWGFTPQGNQPEVVAIMERALAYGARAVFFEAQRHGHPPVAQAFIFDAKDHPD